MASRPSNRRRNFWTVDLLKIGEHDRILEIGCGPGLALASCASRATSGVIVGLDHSQEMLQQATRRNRRFIEGGKVRLEHGGLDRISSMPERFDKVFAVNVVQFISDKTAVFQAILGVLVPGGVFAVTYMPRHRKPKRSDAMRMADDVAAHMSLAGFSLDRVEELPFQPAPAVCVLGCRPKGPGEQEAAIQ
ncbi:MAG: class I SAM-dependent methyltransferase [Magnetococcales bacterium]|nr:class I SAM-dependent methyltransferase [Magnetococcales bacterium]